MNYRSNGVYSHLDHAALTQTTAVCKDLYESNLILKSKHDALVSRLPTHIHSLPPHTSSSSPTVESPISGPSSSVVAYHSRTPSTKSATWSSTSTNENESPSSPSPLNRLPRYAASSSSKSLTHTHRISTSSAELTILSNQNTELLHTLEELESEAVRADKSGKKRLRELEREIKGLKDELESARVRSEELEEEVRDREMRQRIRAQTSLTVQRDRFAFGVHAREQEAEDDDDDVFTTPFSSRMKDRAIKVRSMRARTRPWEDDTDSESPFFKKDFAPPHWTSTLRSRKSLPQRIPMDEPEQFQISHIPSPPASPTPSPMTRSSGVVVAIGYQAVSPENTLVSRLLLKINELEEANKQLSIQNSSTRAKWENARQEADALKEVYEVIGNEAGIQLEMVVGDVGVGEQQWQEELGGNEGGRTPGVRSGLESPQQQRAKTVYFRSLRRKGGDVLDVLAKETFESGIHSGMHSTLPRFSSVPSSAFTVPLPVGESMDLFSPSTEKPNPMDRDFISSAVANRDLLKISEDEGPLAQFESLRSESPLGEYSSRAQPLFARGQSYKLRKSIIGLFNTDENTERHHDTDSNSLLESLGHNDPSLGEDASFVGDPGSFVQSPVTHHLDDILSNSLLLETPTPSVTHEDRHTRRTLGNELGVDDNLDPEEYSPIGKGHCYRSDSICELLESAQGEGESGYAQVGAGEGEVDLPEEWSLVPTHSQALDTQRAPTPSPSPKPPSGANNKPQFRPRKSISAPTSPIYDMALLHRNFTSDLHNPNELTFIPPSFSSIDDKTVNSIRRNQLHSGRLRRHPGPQRNWVNDLIVELWLWLQFAIIITLFIWTAARRGPKAVIIDNRQRR